MHCDDLPRKTAQGISIAVMVFHKRHIEAEKKHPPTKHPSIMTLAEKPVSLTSSNIPAAILVRSTARLRLQNYYAVGTSATTAPHR